MKDFLLIVFHAPDGVSHLRIHDKYNIAVSGMNGHVTIQSRDIDANIDMSNIDTVKAKIEKLSSEFGGFENIALVQEAYHKCHPSREFGWCCAAVKLDGYTATFGQVHWDFDEDLEDSSDYCWDFEQDDFEAVEEYDLEDEDECEDLIKRIS